MKTVALIKRDFHSQGGLEKVSRKIIDSLQEKNVEVTLLTSSPAESVDLPCPVLACNLKRKLNYKRVLEFDAWCKTHSARFDVVFSMDRSSYQTHHRAGNGVHAAYLDLRRQKEGLFKTVSFAINPLHRTLLKLEKATFEDPFLKKIIVNSHFVKNQILRYYDSPEHSIEVVHNGVEWAEMETDFHASFPHTNKPFEFLFIGHNFARKGLLTLLKALSCLKRRDFHLSVVGNDKNLKYYQAQASRLNIPSTFWGAQSNTRPFYQKADVLVIPSLYDPFANVTVEALAMGLFVVSSKTNGGHEVLNPNSGAIFEDHLDSFVTALEESFNHPKSFGHALQIRNSIQYLDYSVQMEKVCSLCLS